MKKGGRKKSPARVARVARVAKPPPAIATPPPKKRDDNAARRVLTPPVGASRQADRVQAGMHFIFDVDCRDVLWWHRERYAHIPLPTFQQWSAKDEWPRRRAMHLQTVEATIARRVVSEITKAQVEEVRDLLDARRVAKSFAIGRDEDGKPKEMVAPKSWGEAVGAFVKLDERVDVKRSLVMGALPLGANAALAAPADATAGLASLPFDDGQILAMAHAAVAQSNNLLPAAQDGDPDDSDEDAEHEG